MIWLKSVVVLVLIMVITVDSHWLFGRRRRRRRRIPQPRPEPNCHVSAWSSWSSCSRKCTFGKQSRSRSITYRPTTFCKEPSLWQSRNCGDDNGGCDDHCDPHTGACSCPSGYKLLADKKRCQDINECLPNGGRGPCSHICRNRDGGYRCRCPNGYYLGTNGKTCIGRNCNQPILPSCLTPMLANSCKKVTVNCLTGTLVGAPCHFSCPINYDLAKITNKALPFARDIVDADFRNVIRITTCRSMNGNQPKWSSSNSFKDLYCRRTNDPPTNIAISKNTIKEHTANGTTVAVISATDPQRIAFSVQQSSGFFFFKAKGNKLVNTWVPRWRNLQGLQINDYHVIIRATDAGVPPLFSEKNFTITVLNVNDPPHSIRISNNSVMDTATLNHVVGTLSAVDDDGPRRRLRNSYFVWTLIDNDNGRFSLSGSNLAVAASLDHQAHRYHRVIVKCTDKDKTDPRSSQATIIINVINTNDSPKNIKFKPFKLYENATSGFIVGRLIATDQDGDAIKFSIRQSTSTTLDTFRLGTTVCVNKTVNSIRHSECKADVILRKAIDYEAKNSYILMVTATDPTGSFAIKDYLIHVVNLNEAPTDITLSNDNVAENSPAGTVVGQITVTDPDTQQRSPQGHKCSVTPSSFSTNGLNLIVSTSAVLNYELKQSYLVEITCTDTGIPPLSLKKQFIIKVKDVNEPPNYLHLTKSIILENRPVGSVVGDLVATDPDVRNTKLTFMVKSPANSPFGIGGLLNHTLVTTRLLDYETTKQQDILISVTDDGGLSLEKFFTIKILNVNEAPTDLILSPTTLPENSPAGTRIGSITVVDPDTNSTASCRIIQGSTDYFAVSGLQLVSGTKKVDYESLGSTKTLTVKLRCADEYGLFLDKLFHISITDVNEPPTQIDVTLSAVPENKVGAIVGQISVKDPDVGQSHSCKVLHNNADSTLFTVDPSTLQIKTIKALDFESQRRHQATLRCTDVPPAKHIRFTVFKDITIDVIDVNEVPRNPCLTTIYIDEAASSGSVVWSFTTTDPDNDGKKVTGATTGPKKQYLKFSLDSSVTSLPFSVAGEQYLVKSGSLNRVQKSVYSLSINVTDDGRLIRLRNGKYEVYQGSKSSAVYNCKAEILATGDSRLSLDITLSSNTVSEDAANGTVIGALNVIHGQKGEMYTLKVVDEKGVPFTVVGNELVLVVGKFSLDYEETNTTGVKILAVGSQGKTVQKLFLIRITNVNEKPIKMCLRGNHTIQESKTRDQLIGRVAIEDPDHQETKDICSKKSSILSQGKYYNCIIDSNYIDVSELRKRFYVDKNLDLYGNSTFSYKKKKSYAVPINCKDINKPIHQIQITSTINVIKASVQPTWDLSLSSNNVSEDANSGTIIGIVSVIGGVPTDTYSFKVADINQPFKMEGNKLTLSAKKSLDYEAAKSVALTVVSKNSVGKSIGKVFTIVITNVNEKPVNMCLLNMQSTIPEKSPTDTAIGQIAIEDPDHLDSKGICQKSRSPASQYLSYTCEIASSTVSVRDFKAKFYIDQHFYLHRKGDLSYKDKQVYNVPIRCRELLKPIHLIQRTFTVKIQAPKCPARHVLSNGVCICAGGFTGVKCDRDATICKNTVCQPKEVCVSHVDVATRCVPKVNQIPMLLRLGYSTVLKAGNLYKIESYVESIFEGKWSSGQTLSSQLTGNAVNRRRRDIPKDVYVEAATSQQALSYSYVIFVAMDPKNRYEAQPGDKMCALFKNTDIRCVNAEDCEILKKAGIECPYKFVSADDNATTGKSKKNDVTKEAGAKPWMYGVGSAALIVVVVVLLACFVLKRRQKKKSDEPIQFASLSDDAGGHSNPVYDVLRSDSPQQPTRISTVKNNLAAETKKPPVKIKTFENTLYKKQNPGKYDTNNPVYEAGQQTIPTNENIYDSVGKLQGKMRVDMLIQAEMRKANQKPSVHLPPCKKENSARKLAVDIEEEKLKAKEEQFVELPPDGKQTRFANLSFAGLQKPDNRNLRNVDKSNNDDSKC